VRLLSAALAAAQRSPSARPWLGVELHDRDVSVARLRWERWYTGTEPDGPCALAVAGDGALLRARIDPATAVLHVQRVAAPAATSQYALWSQPGSVAVAPRLGLAADGTRALLATVRTNGVDVEVRESTDGGATYGASVLLHTAAATVTAIACTVRADGTAVVVFAHGGVVYVVRRPGGSPLWLAPAAWTLSLATVSGLAAWFEGDHQVLVSGSTAAGVAGAWSTLYGAGNGAPPNTWLQLSEIAAAASGTNVSYLATGIGHADAPRAVLVEAYGGPGAYQRVHIASGLAATLFPDQAWRDPVPFAHASAHGLGFVGAFEHAWLGAPNGVWHATSTAEPVALDDDLLEATMEQSLFGGELRLMLRNEDGRYAAGAAPLALAPGGELRVAAGYETQGGGVGSVGPRFWIVEVRRRREGGRAVVEVAAVDGWGVLRAWTAPRQLTWAGGSTTAALVLLAIARRAGLRLLGPRSAEANALQPAFTVRAGERASTALRRLLEALPDRVLMRGETPTLFEPLATDAATYTFGEAHAVQSVRLDEAGAPAGWARVFGLSLVGEAVDAAALAAGAGTVVVVDDNLVTQARTSARAVTALRAAALAPVRGEIVCAPQVAQEPGDVIELTDAALGLVRMRFRVQSLRLRYVRGGPRPRYEQTLVLGAV
jgi:hypothetical protein